MELTQAYIYMADNPGSTPTNDFWNFRFPDVNRTFLRGIFWILGLIFLASIFSLAQGIYSKFFQLPEVRKIILQVGHDINLGSTILIQRAIIIHNRGNADARNVYIQCSVPAGRVTRISIVSEESYREESVASANACNYSLDRLAANAKFTIFLWATVSSASISNNNTIDYSLISATYDGGSAEFGHKPTALEEMRSIGTIISQGLSEIAIQTDRRIRLDTLFQYWITTSLPAKGVYIWGIGIDNASDLRSVVITSVLILVALWLFFSKLAAGVGFAAVTGFLAWLYLDFSVHYLWLAVPLAIAMFEIVDLYGDINTTRSQRLQRSYGKEIWILFFFLCAVSLVIVATYTGTLDTSCISGDTLLPTCIPLTVNGGLWMGLTVFALYFFVVDI